jgi:hypothetical protein
MQPADLLTGWDATVFMLPLFSLLAIWMFGLDERFSAPKARTGRPRFCPTDPAGEPRLTDPDGNVFGGPRRTRKPSSMRQKQNGLSTN